MEIYYFGTNGEKVGPVTKEGLSKLIESGVVVESTKLQVNGKQYIAGQIQSLSPLFEKRRLKGQQGTEQSESAAPRLQNVTQTNGDYQNAPGRGGGSTTKREKFKRVLERIRSFCGFAKKPTDVSKPYIIVWWILSSLLPLTVVLFAVDFALGIIRLFKVAFTLQHVTFWFRIGMPIGFLLYFLIMAISLVIVFAVTKYLYGLAVDLKDYEISTNMFFTNFWKIYKIVRRVLILFLLFTTITLMFSVFLIEFLRAISPLTNGFMWILDKLNLSDDLPQFLLDGLLFFFVRLPIIGVPLCGLIAISSFFNFSVIILCFYWVVSAVCTADDTRRVRIALEDKTEKKE